MKKVAIFGNAGGGKSTLAKKLAHKVNLPLYALDKIKYRAGGAEVPHEEYLQRHREILNGDSWIIDGFGCVPSAWERFASADTLVFIDLPLWMHFLWVTKRIVTGMFVTPEGWPQNSPILKGTMNSYRVLWLCHKKLTPRYRQLVQEAKTNKQVFHLRTPKEIKVFVDSI